MPDEIDNLRMQILAQNLKLSLILRRAEITTTLLEKSGQKVMTGPFSGMTLLKHASWSDGDIAPKLLGCYEEELQAVVAAAVARNPQVVVNVGCAEGFYAVGLARLLPQARIFAFDIDPAAQAICRNAAEANGVARNVSVGGACTPDTLRKLIAAEGRTCLFVDCEGAEKGLLDPAQLPELRRCDIVVECHDFIDRSITATLTKRLAATHRIEHIVEGARDPNRFEYLRGMESADRWLAVNESRPETMNWIVAWAA